jgi:hypothetical protein
MPTLLMEVTWARDTATTVESTRVTVVLATETFAQEAVMVRDSAALRVKDVENWAALAKRVTLE